MPQGFKPDIPESAPLVFSEPENAVSASPADFEAWKARIGDYVKFVDEQAAAEAFRTGTAYPLLYIGKLQDVFVIKIYQDEILYARIKPMWSDEIQSIPATNVRFAD